MSWFADLAGKAESLLNNLDEQTGVALRNHNVTTTRKKRENTTVTDYGVSINSDTPWMPKKRPLPRSLKKAMPIPETKTLYSPSRKASPTSHHQSRSQIKDTQDSSRNGSVKSRKSPSRKSSPQRQYNLNNCPKTLVGDVKENDLYVDHFGLKHRRFSLPSDLELLSGEDWSYKMQNMEVENAMLKNELNVMNREVAELLDRLRKTEDGNDVDSLSEVTKTRIKLETTEVLNHRLNLEKQSLMSQIKLLEVKMQETNNAEVAQLKEQHQCVESEAIILRSRNKELEDRCKEMLEKARERDGVQIKLENDLRHAQSTIADLQNNLQKTTDECKRLEKDWEAYKLRVKNMLVAKDKEIKTMKEGLNFTEDTRVLMEQIDNLKDERDELSEAVAVIRAECNDMKTYLQQVDSRHNTAKRVVAALRDELKEERAARDRAEVQAVSVAKDLKAIQIETGQTIASLRTALRDKENELMQVRETTSTVRTTDTSALNVADYDVMQETIDNNKIHHLTQTLVQKQTKIDNLLAENNMLRIQLEKVECKYKTEVASLRANFNHSVVHFDGDSRSRSRHARFGYMFKRYPVIKLFVFAYMVMLHLWVLTVLFKSTPEDYLSQSTS
ncbi:unnamed protein product [Chrysodeixis includens]|uniref:Golgin-84 n=1 Tax=Chrysodeixis includens TaxID=689277 RepID=A0A9P0BUF9_CHRIL|nr:unnamed protein product [Chrysodeixis includens]